MEQEYEEEKQQLIIVLERIIKTIKDDKMIVRRFEVDTTPNYRKVGGIPTMIDSVTHHLTFETMEKE